MPDDELPASVPCRTCGAAILWFDTPNHKRMPLNAEPVEYGGTVVIRNRLAVTLKKGEPAEAGEKRFKSHYATCPQAASHRRPKS